MKELIEKLIVESMVNGIAFGVEEFQKDVVNRTKVSEILESHEVTPFDILETQILEAMGVDVNTIEEEKHVEEKTNNEVDEIDIDSILESVLKDEDI